MNFMNPAIRLGAISLDASDPARLADFYRDLLALDVLFDSPDFVALKGAGVLLTTVRVDGHRAATWPTGDVPKQMHLELAVDDLDAAQARAVELGATVATEQPRPDGWRVLIDPEGHPFCVTGLIPET